IQTPVQFRDLDHLVSIARDLARKFDDRVVSRSMPVVGAQLPGARVQFVAAPVAPNAGMSVTIRKFRALFGIEELLDFGALTPDMASLLSDAVTARANILVSGGTGSGKTTMINSLSAFIPDSERVITIEDALELSLTNTFVESLLTKEASSGDDTVIIGQPELLRATLRMRPDRVIVGEIRDSGGCAVMLQAANTGHDGTMTTVHANDPDRALRRLSLLLRGSSDGMSDDVADEEVRSAFDLVVQVVRHHGRRFVSHISMVNKTSPGTTTLFEGHYTRGMAAPAFQRVGGMGSDTELAMRFANAGLNTDTWE
ncbi:MAG: CpaF family protein, partial [Actinomycetes bacterium]